MYKLSESPRGFAATSISDRYSSMAGLKSYSDGAWRMIPAVPTVKIMKYKYHDLCYVISNCTVTFGHVQLKGLG